jgi:hypothetical protein
MRLIRHAFACFLLLAGFGAASAEANAGNEASVRRWLTLVEACAGTSAPRLAIIGLDGRETAASPEEAEQVRYSVEEIVQKISQWPLSSASDVTRLKAMREGTIGLSGEEAENQIRKAFAGVSVFFVAPIRQGQALSLRLQAITPDAACKATSDPLTLALAQNASEADPGRVMSEAVARLFAAAPEIREVDVLPFSAEAGHSACSAALADALMVALDAEARGPNRVLSGKTLTAAYRASERPAELKRASAIGRFDLDAKGRAHLALEFRRAGATLAPTGRVAIAIDRLACDPTIRPFLDHVAASAKTDRARLDLSAEPLQIGERLDIRITIGEPMRLFCWVIAPDRTAFVLLPAEEAFARELPAGPYRYPRSFDLQDIVISQAFDNLASCYGLDAGSAAAIEPSWRPFAPAANKDALLIPAEKTEEILAALRRLPGIVEATARLVSRP